MTNLVQLDGCVGCPSHAVINEGDKVSNLAAPWNIHFANTGQGLLRRIEMLQEDHDRTSGNLGLYS